MLSVVLTDETAEDVVADDEVTDDTAGEDVAEEVAAEDEFADDVAVEETADEVVELFDETALLCSLNEPTLSPADSFALFEQPVSITAAKIAAAAAFPIPCFIFISVFSFTADYITIGVLLFLPREARA